MQSKIEKYSSEIRSFLEERNIFYDKNTDYNFNYIGIILNILKENKKLEKSIHISLSPETLPEYDYNLVLLEKEFHQEYTSAEYLQKNLTFEKFYEQQLGRKINFYRGENNGHTYIMVRIVEGYFYTNVVAALTSVLPKLFDGLFSKDEIRKALPFLQEVAMHCGDSNIDDIILAKSYFDFEAIEREYNRQKLQKAATFMAEQRMKNAKSRYEEYRQKCEEHMREYNSYVQRMNDQIMLMNGMNNNDAYVTSFVEYLTSNQRVKIVDINDATITYDVLGNIDFFDDEMFNTYVNNTEYGAIYSGYDISDRKILKEIMYDIFKFQKYKVKAFGRFRLLMDHIPTLDTNAIGYSEARRAYPSRCPSPHVILVNCQGDFSPVYNEALRAGNIIMAIETTISYASNINWSDSYVTGKMINEIKTNKCIECVENGEMYCLEELLAKYREEKNNG